MKIFFDTEFTDLRKDCDLISIGLITEKGDMFYGDITDYAVDKCSDWVKDNVLPKLGNPNLLVHPDVKTYCFQWKTGTKVEVADSLLDWLEKVSNNEKIQFVSDCCHFDFVLLLDLLAKGGDVFEIPINISMSCDDLNIRLANALGVDLDVAFDLSREKLFNKKYSKDSADEIFTGNKHNALYDAFVIWKLYVK